MIGLLQALTLWAVPGLSHRIRHRVASWMGALQRYAIGNALADAPPETEIKLPPQPRVARPARGFDPVMRDPMALDTGSAEARMSRTLEAMLGRISLGAGPVQTRWSTFGGGLTPDKISSAIRQADAGLPWTWADMCEHVVEVDGHLGGIIEQRIAGIVNKPFRVEPPEHLSDDYLAITLANFMRAVMVGIRSFRDALFGLLWADGIGYALAEIVWDFRRIEFVAMDRDGDEKTMRIEALVPVRIDTVHPKHVVFDQSTDEPRLWLNSGRPPLPPGKFVFHTGYGIQPIMERRGFMRSCVWLHAFKHWALRDEQIWLHRYGIPQLLLRYNPQHLEPEEAKSIAAQISKDWGQGLSAIVEDWFTGEAHTVGGAGVHRDAAVFFNQEMSKRVLGATGTVEGGLNGSYNQAQVMEGVVWDVKAGSAGKLCETVQQDVFAPCCEVNLYELAELLGEPPARIRARMPWLTARIERENTPSERLAVVQGLSTLGYPLSKRQLGKEFHVDQAEGKDILAGPSMQIAKDTTILGAAHIDDHREQQAQAPSVGDGAPTGSSLMLTATDQGTIVKVNEGRASVGLGPLLTESGQLDPDGNLTIAQYKAKHMDVMAAAASASAPPGMGGGGGGGAGAGGSEPKQENA